MDSNTFDSELREALSALDKDDLVARLMQERGRPLLSDVLTPLRDYLGHGSWRCDRSNHDRFPSSDWDKAGDCYCGFVGALIQVGCSKPEALHIAKELA